MVHFKPSLEGNICTHHWTLIREYVVGFSSEASKFRARQPFLCWLEMPLHKNDALQKLIFAQYHALSFIFPCMSDTQHERVSRDSEEVLRFADAA
jgi:hypothetical protein